MLGFGVDAALVLMTPVVLQVAKDVIGFLGEQLRERAREEGEGAIDRVIARLVNRNGGEGEAEPVAELTDEQLEQVRALAIKKAGRSSSPTSAPRCSPTPSSGAWRWHERRGGRTGAPAPPESVRLPLRHGVSVRAPHHRGARGEPLRLEWIASVFADKPSSSRAPDAPALPARQRSQRPRAFTAASRCIHRVPRTASFATRCGGCSAEPAACCSWPPRSCSGSRSGSRRRRRLQPLTPEDAPAALDAVRELARERGSPAPRLLWNPLDASPGGLAFGHPGRYSVALTGGLLVRQATDPPAFARSSGTSSRTSATETSASRTSRSRSGTRSSLVAVLPFALTLFDEGVGYDLQRHLEAARARALVYLTRNAVLRSREVYADVRASVSDGPDGALRRVLAELPAAGCGVARKRCGACTPTRVAGFAAVDDTRPLFPLGAVVAFARRPLRERSPTTASSRSCPRSSPTPSTCASRRHWRTRRSSWVSSASPSGARRSLPSRTGASPPRRGSTAWRCRPVS